MKESRRKLLEQLKNPPTWGKAINFATTVVAAVAALCMLLVDYEGNALSIVAYTLFGFAGVSLTYSVYLLVRLAPHAKQNAKAFLERYPFTRLLLQNYGFRTVIFAIGSFAISVAFSLFNGYMGIVNRSIWYGALAAYYIALAFLRGGILLYHKGKIGKSKTVDFTLDEYAKANVYKNSGIVLLILCAALSSAIAQMIFSDAHFIYVGWTIYAYAAYAFYKITMSIVHLFRATRQSDLTVQAIRNVNFADASVSILALQTALLATFSDGQFNASLMNTVTGVAVSAFSIGLGVYMIITAHKKIRALKKEEKNHE